MLITTMSMILADLLQARQPQFDMAVDQLELGSGRSSQDVHLSAEILSLAHQKIKHLGLDPQDSTAEEIYGALMNIAALHDNFLLLRLGLAPNVSQMQLNDYLVTVVGKLGINKSCWALKNSVAKRLIKAHPPKQVMKSLGYRSVDSLLKRQEVGVIMVWARLVESAKWMETLFKTYHKLKPSDFEVREILFVNIELGKNSPIKAGRVISLKELGVVAVTSGHEISGVGAALYGLLYIVHQLNEVRMYSAFFKHLQTKKSFGSHLAKALLSNDAHPAKVADTQLHWRVLHHHFSRQDTQNHPELFEPHVSFEDLQWRSAEEVLFRLEPALQFWIDLNWVGSNFDKGPVSFNLLDAAQNLVQNKPFSRRSFAHMQACIWNELLVRYVGQPNLEHLILKQLDQAEIDPEMAMASISEVY